MRNPITLTRRNTVLGVAATLSTSGAPHVWAKTPKPFPDNDPYLNGYYAPVSRESDEPQLHDLNMVIDENGHAPPSCTVEIVIHLHHTRLVARATAVTLQEAVDLAVLPFRERVPLEVEIDAA